MEGAKEDTPSDLVFDTHVFALDFSPEQDIVACGQIDGNVTVWSYSSNENRSVLHLQPHKKACRALQFSHDGQRLFTASTDTSIKEIDLNGGKITWGQGKAHAAGINAMAVHYNTIFTGDEDGAVKVWDARTKRMVYTFVENEDFISDFALHANLLLCPSGDGTLSVFDIRKGKLEVMSENLGDELLSVAVMKNGSKVVCGSQGGILNLFTWGNFGASDDSFPGHPDSIDTIIPINQDIICTGSSDGLIRVVNILPNQLLGVIGEHEDYPVERLSMSRDKNLLASCSHDNTVKFWNISYFWEKDTQQEGAEGEGEREGEEEEEKKIEMEEVEQRLKETLTTSNNNSTTTSKSNKEANNMKNFFSDL